LIDLHAHTTASDGSLTPRELIRLANAVGLQALAITDHDTVDGLPAAVTAAADTGLELVPGIELAVDYSPGRFHMLGYFIDHDSAALTGRLRELKENRARRNASMVERMQNLGLDLTMEDVIAESGGGVIARPHMAKALVRKGVVSTVREAFELYLGEGRPAHIPKDKISIQQGIDLIHSAGGLASAAHPNSLGLDSHQAIPAFKRFREIGLDGVECYYSQFTPEQTEFYLRAASDVGLLPTGGSDFHGDSKPHVQLGQVIDGRPVAYDVLHRLKRARVRRFGDVSP
jgi:predicted metal-dependent phosphoesterase TrpH